MSASASRARAVAVLAGLASVTASAQLTIVNNQAGAFIDISGIGTPLPLSGDLEVIMTTSISNTVFPGGPVIVANNGGLGFFPAPDMNLGPINAPLPSLAAFGGGKALLGYWDDIGNTVGRVYWHEIAGDRLIVQWNNKPLEDGDGDPSNDVRITFQMQIFHGVTRDCTYAQMLYQNVLGAFGDNATIGYQDGIGGLLNDVQWSFNTPSINNGTTLSLTCIPEPSTLGMLALAAIALRRR